LGVSTHGEGSTQRVDILGVRGPGAADHFLSWTGMGAGIAGRLSVEEPRDHKTWN